MLKQNISCLKFTRFITRSCSTQAKSYCLVCVFDYSYTVLSAQYKKSIYFKLYQDAESKTLCPIYLRSLAFNHLIMYLVIMKPSMRSVWENLDQGRAYKPNVVRSVHMTVVKILPYRPAKLG